MFINCLKSNISHYKAVFISTRYFWPRFMPIKKAHLTVCISYSRWKKQCPSWTAGVLLALQHESHCSVTCSMCVRKSFSVCETACVGGWDRRAQKLLLLPLCVCGGGGGINAGGEDGNRERGREKCQTQIKPWGLELGWVPPTTLCFKYAGRLQVRVWWLGLGTGDSQQPSSGESPHQCSGHPGCLGWM